MKKKAKTQATNIAGYKRRIAMIAVGEVVTRFRVRRADSVFEGINSVHKSIRSFSTCIG